ncbi:MAG: hypothetical protein HQ507_02805 [Candidatus Marinimicrobia bacterium]|nr:hypothetical protein [Candidatus Neomarinimicrobiota bacterium]
MMKKSTKLYILIIMFSMTSPQIQAWYPEYSVLATEFPVRDDFLRPLSLHSTASLGLGEYFQYLYKTQPDFRFFDPTYPLENGKHFFYMDLGSERLWGTGDAMPGTSPIYYELSSAYIQDYAFWSPYRELSHEQIPEPALRLFYLTRLSESADALTLGGSYSLAYDETQFYQPYSFDYFRNFDAMGAEYDDSQAYEDYRLREAGDDESISTEQQLNLFLSKSISQRLSIGARLGIVRSQVDGNFGDFQFEDRSEWADEYEYYLDDDIKRNQSQKMNDINIGIAYKTPQHKRIAINAGIVTGNLDRTFSEVDTNRYYSINLNPDDNPVTLDSNIYRSASFFRNEKDWGYTGRNYYLRMLAELPQDENLTLRIAGSAEWRKADLSESESMLRRSDYFNQYFASYDGVWNRYSSQSMAEVERSGSGEYSSEFYQLSAGADWQLQPGMRFFGGLFLEHSDRTQDAREPFVGSKHAATAIEGYYYDYNTLETWQSDLKIFAWKQHQWRSTLAAPLGIEYQILPAIGLQLGVTKIFQRMRLTEGYDVIVEEYTYREVEDGVVTRDELDADYVDGYQYPVIKDFSDRFDFNAGLNIRSGDKLRVSMMLKRSSQGEYIVKVGGSISW